MVGIFVDYLIQITINIVRYKNNLMPKYNEILYFMVENEIHLIKVYFEELRYVHRTLVISIVYRISIF